MPHYAIGDLQGCFNELLALLEHIKFNPREDKLWFTGDLVNRGPSSLNTLRFVKSLGNNAVTVLGNHDLHFIAIASGQSKTKKQDTLTEVLTASDCGELCDWLRQQPLLYHDKTLGYTLVHAGLPPQWSLPAALKYAHEVETALRGKHYKEFLTHMYGHIPQCWDNSLSGWDRLRLITNYFTRMRFCDAQGTLDLTAKGKVDSPPPGLLPWFKIPTRAHQKLQIIFGHWAALEGETDEPNVYALDTGCVWGNHLTAMRLEDKQRFSVPCGANSKVLVINDRNKQKN